MERSNARHRKDNNGHKDVESHRVKVVSAEFGIVLLRLRHAVPASSLRMPIRSPVCAVLARWHASVLDLHGLLLLLDILTKRIKDPCDQASSHSKIMLPDRDKCQTHTQTAPCHP